MYEKTKGILCLFAICFFLFFIFSPIHELTHWCLDYYLPGTRPVALHVLDSVAISQWSIMCVSVQVIDQDAALIQLYYGELIAFLVQFFCVLTTMFVALRIGVLDRFLPNKNKEKKEKLFSLNHFF